MSVLPSSSRFQAHVAVLGELRPKERGQGRWRAPTAYIHAPYGFGEEVWMEEEPETVLATSSAGAPVYCEAGAHRGARSDQRHPNHLTVQPTGRPNYFTAPGEVWFEHVYLPDRLIAETALGLGLKRISGLQLRDDLVFFHDADLHGFVQQYHARARDDALAPTALEMDARATLIVERLLTRHHGERLAQPPYRGGLSSWQARRVTEFLEGDLAADVPLSELAALVGLSANHFCTAFRRSMGEPPHRWLVRRRIERAKEMLADPRLSITDVALAAGFGSSAHFATAFRKQVGVTPSRYRQEVQP